MLAEECRELSAHVIRNTTYDKVVFNTTLLRHDFTNVQECLAIVNHTKKIKGQSDLAMAALNPLPLSGGIATRI